MTDLKSSGDCKFATDEQTAERFVSKPTAGLAQSPLFLRLGPGLPFCVKCLADDGGHWTPSTWGIMQVLNKKGGFDKLTNYNLIKK